MTFLLCRGRDVTARSKSRALTVLSKSILNSLAAYIFPLLEESSRLAFVAAGKATSTKLSAETIETGPLTGSLNIASTEPERVLIFMGPVLFSSLILLLFTDTSISPFRFLSTISSVLEEVLLPDELKTK
ncbi:hypothetical protein D9M68_744690 [compost metagenome]